MGNVPGSTSVDTGLITRKVLNIQSSKKDKPSDIRTFSFEISENEASGDCLFLSIQQFLERNKGIFPNITSDAHELRAKISNFVLTKTAAGFQCNWDRFKDSIVFNLQNRIPILAKLDDKDVDIKEAKKSYFDYMSTPGNCGTFTELQAAADLFGFIGYVLRVIDNETYFCYEFGFGNNKELNGKKPVVHFIFNGPLDEGHFRLLTSSSKSSINIEPGQYNLLKSSDTDIDDSSLSITNITPTVERHDIATGFVCDICNADPLLSTTKSHTFATKKGLKIHIGKMHKDLAVDVNNEVCDTEPSNIKCSEPEGRVQCPFSPSRTFQNRKRLQSHMDKKHSDEILNLESLETITPDSLAKKLMFFRNNVSTIRRIPKGARYSAADKLSNVISACLEANSVYSWSQLLSFSYISFHIKGDKDKSLTSKIKENIKNFDPVLTKSNFKSSSSLAKRVEAKVNDFDIKGAIRILSSKDKLAPFDASSLSALQSKHPPATTAVTPCKPVGDISPILVDERQVRKKINSFDNGSGPGIDGFRPQFLKDMISKTAGDAGLRVLSAITRLCNFILAGKVREDITTLFFGASLCGLSKKDNGVRPIAVGNALRRLAGKLACSNVQEEAHSYLNPSQVGVATKLGAESVVHAVRTYVFLPSNRYKILLKIDFENAFNSIDRGKMLSRIAHRFPRLYPLLSSSYLSPSLLLFGENTISSETGCQQGDPCGPLAFSVALHPVIQGLKSELNSWYLDDGTLAGDPDVVLEDFRFLIKEAADLGLKINPDKCELFFISGSEDRDIVDEFQQVAPGIRILEKHQLEILGSPIFEDGYEAAFENKLADLKLLLSRLVDLNSHTSYFLLKNCLYIPKMTYLLRTCAFWKFPQLTSEMDMCLKNCLQSILNITLDDLQWSQAVLPISKGGLGIRSMSHICLPAFLSSLFGVQNLVSRILPVMDTDFQLHHSSEALDFWKSTNGDILPSQPAYQRNWDSINLDRIVSTDLKFNSIADNARFKALQEPESGGWLQVVPSINIGTAMNDQDFQTCIALRLGSNFSTRHKCICGAIVYENGLHGLSCPKCKGRLPRHFVLNHIFHRALSSIRFGSTLEPVGLFRDDGKRPDGMTLSPWSNGQRLVWDVTCVDTMAPSYLQFTNRKPGAAAELACSRKHSKYTKIKASNFKFIGLAFETLGPWCKESKQFIEMIGNLLIEESGDLRAKKFFYERISLAIQQGNAASILGTYPSSAKLDEIHKL